MHDKIWVFDIFICVKYNVIGNCETPSFKSLVVQLESAKGVSPGGGIYERKERMKEKELFSNEKLTKMIVPLFLEQFLVMLVGLADTLVISYAGEAAVSGVSLVNQFNTIFIYLFTALASGGAVVISQYIGRQERVHAGEAASQLLLFSTFFLHLLLGLCWLEMKQCFVCCLGK